MMLSAKLVTLLGIITLVSAAAVHPARQPQSNSVAFNQQACMTIYSYITVTVTNQPERVTVAIPDYNSISSSLASQSTIDSLYVVAQSQDAPIVPPEFSFKNTVIPTFIKTVNAPAVELTEIPNSGGPAVYLPGTKPITTVNIETFTESIIVGPFGVATTLSPQSPERAASSLYQDYTVPPYGWNNTNTNVTDFLPLPGTGVTRQPNSTATSTETTFVSTTTEVTDVTVTPAPSYDSPPPWSEYGYGSQVKRQTCVLISAQIGGQWASWCNNWDGSTTYTYTSWLTTITPGVVSHASVIESPSSTISSTSSQYLTNTIPGPGRSTAVPSLAPPSCGETGAFNIGFDDLPKQSVSNASNAGLPPIFSPYKHFYWADGWSYLPPPNDPYPPINGVQLAIYVPPARDSSSPQIGVGEIRPGGFGAGARSYLDAYWFDARQAWVGCDNNATDPSGICQFVAEAYVWDAALGRERIIMSKTYGINMCHSPTCQLTQIVFPDAFQSLSSMNFYANIGGTLRTFYIDDIDLAWSNNTCEAGSLRASSRK